MTAVWSQVERLTADLRRRGCDVATADLVDAATALTHIEITNRTDLQTVLNSTLVKQAHHQATFDEVFDRWFPKQTSMAIQPRFGDDTMPTIEPPPSDEQIEQALDPGSEADLYQLASDLVDHHGGIDDGARTERYHLYRTLRAVDLTAILNAGINRSREHGTQIDRAEIDARADQLRSIIASEIRARLTNIAGTDELGRTADPFDIELSMATNRELDDIRQAIHPLARRLASQLRRRRRSPNSGRVDVRHTIRRSLSSGGIPLDIVNRRPRPKRPQVFVLCDISGSVADFSGFTLTLISALADELELTRTFAFVDAVDEVTELIANTSGVIEPWQLLQSARVIGADGHSDYGSVITSFWERYGRQGLSQRSTVIIVGDARGNHRPPRDEVLGLIASRSRRVYWLNPEPRAEWDTTDSTQSIYRQHCTSVFEVRSLRQMSAAVLEML